MALRDITKIDPKNVRRVKAPLEIDVIKEFFQNKDLFFVVDYSQSQIKGNMFLTYLSNLDLNCEIDLSQASVEDRFQLVKIYMETRNLNDSDVLKLTVAELMMTYKGIDTRGIFTGNVLNENEKAKFIEENGEMFKKWDHFLSSLNVFMIKSLPKLNEQMNVEKQFPEVVDPAYTGLNIVNLLGVPGFVDFYLSVAPTQDLSYFKHQFEDYMYNGKNLFHFFYCQENTLFVAFEQATRDKDFGKDFIQIALDEGI